MDKYVTELIGTFFLTLTICLAAGAGYAGALAPVAIGCVLIAMIFAGGHISGAHYNPAVTLAMWRRELCEPSEVPGYLAAQFGGAILAVVSFDQLSGNAVVQDLHTRPAPAFLAELLFTFALVWVILNVAAAKGTEGNSFYGLAIGLTVTGGAYAVGPVSGAVFNPAVAVGLSMIGLTDWDDFWIYLFATPLGALAAAFTFGAIVKD